MHLHILGICGTFMGGIALLAREMGHRVTGSDANVYPPMSTQLEAAGITLMEGYAAEHLDPEPDLIVVGNAMSRGNPAVEQMLNRNFNYCSGPQWLSEHLLHDRWVLAVAGTHGKTTTSSMIAWILEYAGINPGYLIGGIPANFGHSARLGESPFFVVEADEYDTAFFDKRSKFVHYRPRTVVLNNLEFDHADIFDDLEAIKRQFHHLVRIVPSQGLLLVNQDEANLTDVLARGCWTPQEHFSSRDSADWSVKRCFDNGADFELSDPDNKTHRLNWDLLGEHNRANALAAIAAARHAGIPVAQAVEALSQFKGIKRRLEKIGTVNNITLYDDFAHHPTAIETTLAGLRAAHPKARLVAILEPRSNTMRLGIHKETLANSLQEADVIHLYQPKGLEWSMQDVIEPLGKRAHLNEEIEPLITELYHTLQAGDQVVIMSNGAFGGLHLKLLHALQNRDKN
ncbi:MAG: UDP-N-acetylmuramate:L-alanyl-gamma-D-glutamyl-meso-diaminopimelate ligase [Gammaproteobacteria bacterium]|nr:UDP-N-acetylmuramate:L-alanyl-gamma-D-glutamyl-meso-diaminopimelate ligase [Gammaproteobacteria bacterium]